MKKAPRGLVREDEELPLEPSPWTDEQVEALHRMAKERLFMEQVRKRGLKWIAWFFGVPGAIILFWEQLEKIWKLLSWKFK